MPGIAHSDSHRDHEGRRPEQFGKHLSFIAARSASLEIQDHMHHDHPDNAQSLHEVEFRLPPHVHFLIRKISAHHFVSLNRIR